MKNTKKGIIISLFLLILISSIISATMCSINETEEVLKKALYDYLPNPQASELNIAEIKDLLSFYLNSTNLTVAKCDIKATSSNINYDIIINKFLNFTKDITIPSCADGTPYGKCSITKPKYCFAGQLVNRCGLCGCTSNNFLCQINETAEFTINEGRWGKCIAPGNINCSVPADCPHDFTSYFCQNNNVYGYYSNYTCINPGTINSYCKNTSAISLLVDECDNITKNEYCFYGLSPCQLACSDKTKYETCSATKPLYCSNGNLINDCQKCGCPSGQNCQKDGNCVLILKIEETLTFTSEGKQIVYLSTPKNMTVMAAGMDLISSSNFSSLDIGNNGNIEWNSSVYDVHQKEWVGSCSTSIYLNGGKLGIVWRGGFPDRVRIFPLGGRINLVTIDDVHILINPITDVIMDNLQLDFIDGELKDMGVTMDGSICKISEKNIASVCSSDFTQLFTNYSLSNMQSGLIKIPLKNELILTSGFWKIMFTMHYPNSNILPSNAGVGIKMCGYQETGNMLFTNLSGKKYYENGGVYIQLANQEISDFKTPINNYLATCQADADGNCLVPLVFHSDAAGTIKISNVFITNQSICSDSTTYGQCSTTKPLYCSNGSLVNKCSSCGCPLGQSCNLTSGSSCYVNCSYSGCLSGQSCNYTTGSCYIITKCSDGTLLGNCSSTKPLYCKNGSLINNCNLCGCLADQSCQVGGSCVTPIKPVLNMTFECNAKDYSGNNNEGIIYGATFVAGKVGNALNFDGINDYVDTKDINESGGINSLTIEAWIKPKMRATGVINPMIIGKYYAWNLYINNNNNGFVFSFNDGGGWATDIITYPTTLSIDTWYHVVGRYDGSTCKIFVNGNEVASGACNGNITINTNTVKIGQWNNNEWFNGSIDEVKIYPYALSAEQIQAHYQSEINKIGNLTCKCSDNTLYNQCSSTKPKYCSNGNLIDNCSYCGCSEIKVCQVDGSCVTPIKPVLNMSFECNAKDYSGNNNDGTINGSTFVAGKVSNALNFDGIDDYVDIPSSVSMSGWTAGTIEMWLYLNSTPTTYVATYADIRQSDTYRIHTAFYSTAKPRIALISEGLTNIIAESPEPLFLNTWYHVVGTFDASTDETKIWVNGVLKKTTTTVFTNLVTTANDYISLGGRKGTSSFNGSIDEIKIYPYALSSEQIQAHYQSEINKIGNLTCKCSDNTLYNQCSTTKPKYCSNDALINNCSLCGCPTNQSCQADGSCAIVKTISNLSDGSTEKNITLNETIKNQTVYVEVPSGANITNATIQVTTDIPNASLLIGNDGIPLTSNGTEIILDISSEINEYIINGNNQSNQTFNITGQVIFTDSGTILVPLTFYSNFPGTIKISNININYVIEQSLMKEYSLIEKIANSFILVVILGIIILIFYLYRIKRKRKKK